MWAFCQKHQDYNKFDCCKFHTELFKKFKHFDMNNITYVRVNSKGTTQQIQTDEGKNC